MGEMLLAACLVGLGGSLGFSRSRSGFSFAFLVRLFL
jgi:hypothetical protein